MNSRTLIAAALVLSQFVPGGMAQVAPAPAPAAPTAPKPAAAKPAAPKPAAKPSPVDDVIEMVKAGMSEKFILGQLQKTGKAVNLTTPEILRLKQAGASENIITALQEGPGAAAKPEAATAVAPVAAPVTAAPPAPAPAPAAESVPASAPFVSSAAPPPDAQQAPTQSQKKRVAIDPFEFSAVLTPEMAHVTNQQNLDKGIRAMLITRVQQGGKLVVVERGAKLAQAEAEQDKNVSNRVKQGTGARIGQEQGVDAVLAGDIVIFGNDNKVTTVKGGGIFGSVLDKTKRGDDTNKVVVAIEYRLIDAETSEIISSGKAQGEAERKGRKTSGWGALGQSLGGMDISTTNSGFQQTLEGEATMDCINKLAEIMNAQVSGMKKIVREVETSVVDVSGGTLTIGAGDNESVHMGEVFEIRHVLSILRDPKTKEVLDMKTELVGEMVVASVRPRVATGPYNGGLAKATEDYVAIKRMPPQQ